MQMREFLFDTTQNYSYFYILCFDSEYFYLIRTDYFQKGIWERLSQNAVN